VETNEKDLSLANSQGMARREFIRKSLTASGGVFLGMAVGTKMDLPALGASLMPEQASSRPRGNNGVGNGEDPQPPGNPPINDGPGTGPGNPGNQGGPN
jgi:hypothetical protein